MFTASKYKIGLDSEDLFLAMMLALGINIRKQEDRYSSTDFVINDSILVELKSSQNVYSDQYNTIMFNIDKVLRWNTTEDIYIVYYFIKDKVYKSIKYNKDLFNQFDVKKNIWNKDTYLIPLNKCDDLDVFVQQITNA